MYLHMLPANKKNVPDLIRDPVSLIQDVRTLIGLHRQDSRELAVTGRPVLFLPDDPEHRKSLYPRPFVKTNGGVRPKPAFKPRPGGGGPDKGGPRRRRTRCKKCEACQRSDCGECSFCLDMVKFGGPGRAKQTCNMRQCLQPMLPVTAACVHCGLDGWNQTPVTPLQKGPQRCESASNLMECSVSLFIFGFLSGEKGGGGAAIRRWVFGRSWTSGGFNVRFVGVFEEFLSCVGFFFF